MLLSCDSSSVNWSLYCCERKREREKERKRKRKREREEREEGECGEIEWSES